MESVVSAIEGLYERARERVRARVTEGGRVSGRKLNEAQLAAHGVAYLKTELEACRQLAAWAERVGGEHEAAIARAYLAEAARVLVGGIDLGACETVGLAELGLDGEDVAATIHADPVRAFVAEHGGGDAYLAIAEASQEGGFGDRGFADPMLGEIRSQFARFVDAEVIPRAQDIHREDVLIPMELVDEMSELGVFGLTIPEAYGGLGMSKVAMCVVTEELSRGYIGVGSLGTRAEIAAELILGGGTDAQKERWLPKIASGEVLPTAVFTEPNTAPTSRTSRRGPIGRTTAAIASTDRRRGSPTRSAPT